MSLDRSISVGKKRWILSMRTTNDGRQRLTDAAEANGRSLSEEIENRLERSFQKDDLCGGFGNAAFVDLMGAVIRDVEANAGLSWRHDKHTWEIVRDRIVAEIDRRLPGKEASTSKKSDQPVPSKKLKKRIILEYPKTKSDGSEV